MIWAMRRPKCHYSGVELIWWHCGHRRMLTHESYACVSGLGYVEALPGAPSPALGRDELPAQLCQPRLEQAEVAHGGLVALRPGHLHGDGYRQHTRGYSPARKTL